MTENNAPRAAVRPQDDLFRHVNGHWLTSTTIDDDKASAGSFVTLREEAEKAVRSIVEELDPQQEGERGKVAALYAAFMDEARIEELGAASLRPLLTRIDAIDGPDALARHWGWCLRHGISALYDVGADADADNPTHHTLMVAQDGLGLPDRDYYVSEENAELRQAYLAHVERSLALAGIVDAPAQAAMVLDLETAIAEQHWTRVQTRDIKARHNPMTWQEFSALAPALRADLVLEGAETSEEAIGRLQVFQPSFHTGVAPLVNEERMEQWRAWARWSLVRSLAPYLSSSFVDERFAFYGRTLQGTQQITERWKRGVGLAEGCLGEAIGKIYVERHFPAASKERMDELVTNLLAAYGESIADLDWMGEQTRAEALRKLEKFRPKIGFPAHWRDYTTLEVLPGDLVGSVLAAGRFSFAEQLDKLQRPVDPDEWMMLPQTVNAYYHALRNEIVFPAAILQPPFFDAEASDPVNYGGIGSVIGHEIGHGFDDQGSNCDGDGRLRNWWTDQDHEAFTARTSALVAQYEALTPQDLIDDNPRPHVNGELTIGENIGDLGGVGIALRALRIAHDGELTDEQVRDFFTGYATIWCSKARPERARQLLVIDPHSPAEFRCNQIARNVDAFHEAFGTAPGDGMWLDPQQRVTIW